MAGSQAGPCRQTRDYDAIGCLFGVMNFAGFKPVAAERGLPAEFPARAVARKCRSPRLATQPGMAPGNKLYCSEALTRKDARQARGSWAAVLSVMSALASLHGAADVRLVVSFDR